MHTTDIIGPWPALQFTLPYVLSKQAVLVLGRCKYLTRCLSGWYVEYDTCYMTFLVTFLESQDTRNSRRSSSS